ncbi:MAG: Rrf2 family transcriptional regulator [Spirochaetia bacterium]|jgi:Rrf2 family iron-sulfur cluster assembly transcriptional regulator
MRITTKGRYGLRAVINLAMSNHNRPISTSSIAGEEKVSSEFLEQIFFKLKKAGVIRSVRGPGGGFVLNRKPGEITVQDILEAVGETHGLTPCTLRRRTLCDRPEPCPAHDIWTGLQKAMEDYLTHITLKDILEKNGKRLAAQLESGQDFSI